MKIIIYGLMLLIICTHCFSMTSIRKNRTLVRVRKTTTSMTQFAENETQIIENETEIVGNKTKMFENKTEIGENKTEIGENKTEIGKNKTEIGENKTEIGENKTEILENITEIVELKTSKSCRIKVKVKKNSTKKSLRRLITIPILEEIQFTASHHLPNTRLNEVVVRKPFILSYDQREELTKVVKKLWWNCRLLARFIREETKITTTQTSQEKLKVKQYRELLKPVMDEELYYCDQCTKSFGQFLGIWNHMRSRHKVEVKPTRRVQGQVRGTYNLKRRYTTLKDYYEAHEDNKKK